MTQQNERLRVTPIEFLKFHPILILDVGRVTYIITKFMVGTVVKFWKIGLFILNRRLFVF